MCRRRLAIECLPAWQIVFSRAAARHTQVLGWRQAEHTTNTPNNEPRAATSHHHPTYIIRML